jgi:hypothetical protein
VAEGWKATITNPRADPEIWYAYISDPGEAVRRVNEATLDEPLEDVRETTAAELKALGLKPGDVRRA